MVNLITLFLVRQSLLMGPNIFNGHGNIVKKKKTIGRASGFQQLTCALVLHHIYRTTSLITIINQLKASGHHSDVPDLCAHDASENHMRQVNATGRAARSAYPAAKCANCRGASRRFQKVHVGQGVPCTRRTDSRYAEVCGAQAAASNAVQVTERAAQSTLH